ncbi:MAG TPA: protein kinase, partial [Terriglobales bacterium]|nr:protein kinase [Terriglobales bacterium]
MNPDLWSKVESIFQKAVEADDSRRAAVLEESCAGDENLRREVESLLAQHKNAGDFIERPAFEADPSPAKFGLTTKIGDYEVQSLIGSGGMGEVYRAHDLKLDRDVAVKVLRALPLPDRDRLRRFEQEARAAAALNHPNIVAVFQMGTYEGTPYLVSELLEGLTLREHVQRG